MTTIPNFLFTETTPDNTRTMKRTSRTKLGFALAGVLALIVFPTRVHAAALAYTVTDLGTLAVC